MIERMKRDVLRRVSERTVRFVEPVAPSQAEGLVAEIYRDIGRDFFLGAPITIHSPVPPLLAGLWMAGRETIVVVTHVPRALKEAIAATVADSNACPYCVDMHATMTHAGSMNEAAKAILAGALHGITDASVRRVLEWAHAIGSGPVTGDAPFGAAELPEIAGTAVYFHYVNRVVNAFVTDTALAAPRGLKNGVLRLMGTQLSGAIGQTPEPGASLRYLPEAADAAGFEWAERVPPLAAAWRRWSVAIETAGAAAVPVRARERIGEAVARWTGGPMPLGRAWLPPDDGSAESAATRLGLLVALASYQITEDDMAAVAARSGGQGTLVSLVAWSAFQAARRIMDWAL